MVLLLWTSRCFALDSVEDGVQAALSDGLGGLSCYCGGAAFCPAALLSSSRVLSA